MANPATPRLAAYSVNDFVLPRGPMTAPQSADFTADRRAASIRNLQFLLREQLNYDGTGTRPIWPVQVEPETITREGPFLRYVVSTTASPGQFFYLRDEITYLIHSTDLGASALIANLIRQLLSRQDETAKDINRMVFSAAYNDPEDKRDFEYKTFQLGEVLSPDPPQQESGRFIRPITFQYEYVLMHPIW
jgi:hypothetical protein